MGILSTETMGDSKYHEYQVVGRMVPTEKYPETKIYRMKLFAPNDVIAKSKFWYFMSKLRRVKKPNGQILSCNEIFEKKPTAVKNFGIWLRYDSRGGTHNMYKEYRELTLRDAVSAMYLDMAGRHRCDFSRVQIIQTAVVDAKDCQRENVKQFHNANIKFPLSHRITRPMHKSRKTIFKAARPQTYF